VALLPAVYNQRGDIRSCQFTCCRHHSLSW
jgi:hypothetical protein